MIEGNHAFRSLIKRVAANLLEAAGRGGVGHEILEHYGDSPWSVLLQEILALTKLNWNTADFACSDPITLAFSQRVGQILAELPTDLVPRPEYRSYM